MRIHLVNPSDVAFGVGRNHTAVVNAGGGMMGGGMGVKSQSSSRRRAA